jgi:hypothetical protein
VLGLAALFGASGNAIAQSAVADSGCVVATGPDHINPPDSLASKPSESAPAGSAAFSKDVPDLRILASVTADEVHFAKQPKICVRLRGDARLDSVRVVGRRNLSSPVVSGTTYRNVYVAVEILGHIDASCIASRITGAPADTSAGKRPCASLEVKAPDD